MVLIIKSAPKGRSLTRTEKRYGSSKLRKWRHSVANSDNSIAVVIQKRPNNLIYIHAGNKHKTKRAICTWGTQFVSLLVNLFTASRYAGGIRKQKGYTKDTVKTSIYLSVYKRLLLSMSTMHKSWCG